MTSLLSTHSVLNSIYIEKLAYTKFDPACKKVVYIISRQIECDGRLVDWIPGRINRINKALTWSSQEIRQLYTYGLLNLVFTDNKYMANKEMPKALFRFTRLLTTKRIDKKREEKIGRTSPVNFCICTKGKCDFNR